MKKKIIAVLCSIIIVIPFVFSSPKAAGSSYNNYGTFSKGSYSYSFSTIIEQTEIGINLGTEGVGLNIPWATGSSFTINFQFNDTYSGTVRFTLNSNTGVGYRLLDCLWACDGGYFVSSELPSLTTTSSSKTFYVHVYNSQSVSFTIVSNNVNAFHPSSTQYSGFGVSSFYIDLTDSPDIVDASNYLKDIDLYIPGMSTSLSNIDTDLDNINTNIQALSPYIDQLEQYVDGLEGLLTDLQKVSLYNIEPYQHSAWFWCSKFDASFPRWKYGLPYMQYNLSWNNSQFTASKSFRLGAGYSYIMVFYTNNAISASDITLYYSATTGNVSVTSLPITEITAQLYLQAFIFTNVNQGFSTFEPEINKTFEMYPLYFGLTNNIPDDINAILGREYDNTYTRLLQSINSGIGTLNSNYDTSEYQSYDQVVDNLNDSLLIDVNNSKDNILTDISNQSGSSTGLHLNNVRIAINGLFNDIFTIFPPLKYLVVVGLIILVLGVIL